MCTLSWLLLAQRFAQADARPLHHLRGVGMTGAYTYRVGLSTQLQMVGLMLAQLLMT